MTGGSRAYPLALAAALLAGALLPADAGARKNAVSEPAAVMPAAGAPAAAGPSAIRVLTLPELKAEMARARGKPLLLHFWASWCYPCIVELPALDRFARQLRARGGELLSVSLDTEDRIEETRRMLRARAPSLTPIVARFDDPERFTAAFSAEWEGSIPAVFAYDRRGKLKGSLIGEATASELDELSQPLLARPPR